MRKNKFAVVATIATLLFSCSAAPAFAHEKTTNYDFAYGNVAGGAQAFTIANTELTAPVTVIGEATSVNSLNIKHNFDVKKTIAAAFSEIGTSRPTGWSMPGECLISAARWIHAGGGAWHGGTGTPVGNYANATRLPITAAQPGDIIQYEYIASPHTWATGVHTMLVAGVNADGTLHIVQSNAPAGSGLVTEEKRFKPAPPPGFKAVIWRF